MDASKAPDISQCFNRSPRRASNKLLRFYDTCLKDSGLSAIEFAVLAQIQRHGAVSIIELADFFMRDRSSIRYKLVPLERASLVALVPDARDACARARRIVLTELGKSKLAEATILWHGAQQKFEDAIGTEQAIAMRKAADVIAAVSFDLVTDV